MERVDAMRVLRELITDDDLVILGIGGTNVDWLTLGQREADFGIYAAMGLAQSFGLGLALAQPDRRVLVLEGDGGVLMSLGSLATAAGQPVPNLTHIVFMNRSWGATGNQPLPNAAHLDLAAAARALGAFGSYAATPEDVRTAAAEALIHPGYALLCVECERSSVKDFPPDMRIRLPLEQREHFLRAVAGS